MQLYTRQLTTHVKTETTPPADTADASFLRGHLAVMFGLLMRESPANQEHILGNLDGTGTGGSPRAKLNTLVEQARDFIVFYAALSLNPPDSDGSDASGNRGTDTDTARDRESKIAEDVVVFLEELRDGVNSLP